MSLRQLSDALGLDVSTLHRQTATLLHTGLVERIPDPAGGIAREFRVTAAGDQRLDQERAGIIDVLAAVTQDWTTEDRAEFACYLERFNSDIERLHGRTWPRPNSRAAGDQDQVETMAASAAPATSSA
ncbi:MarR family winged helix-turn-helix transcriptional regulator [Nocardia sp. NPDC049737]|uniref:MarR family winged helix-turn-helix transcriptional regulator n=1 Tax=Nocardia sp. NPDC049737 TaxID=3154358 RepID=UPI00344682D0